MRKLFCTVFDGAAMSSNILEDFLELVSFAAAIKKHPRTVMRWCQNDGLPYTRNGKTVLIHVQLPGMAHVAHEEREAATREPLSSMKKIQRPGDVNRQAVFVAVSNGGSEEKLSRCPS